MSETIFPLSGGAICGNCGHQLAEHSVSLEGGFGPCQKELVEGWEWCNCPGFQPVIQVEKQDLYKLLDGVMTPLEEESPKRPDIPTAPVYSPTKYVDPTGF